MSAWSPCCGRKQQDWICLCVLSALCHPQWGRTNLCELRQKSHLALALTSFPVLLQSSKFFVVCRTMISPKPCPHSQHCRFGLDSRKNFFMEQTAQSRGRFSGSVQKCVAFEDMVNGEHRYGAGSTAGLDDLKVFSSFHGSVILCPSPKMLKSCCYTQQTLSTTFHFFIVNHRVTGTFFFPLAKSRTNCFSNPSISLHLVCW